MSEDERQFAPMCLQMAQALVLEDQRQGPRSADEPEDRVLRIATKYMEWLTPHVKLEPPE